VDGFAEGFINEPSCRFPVERFVLAESLGQRGESSSVGGQHFNCSGFLLAQNPTNFRVDNFGRPFRVIPRMHEVFP
jgi:hypothetical protein